MKIALFDTSALIKRYKTIEKGFETVEKIFHGKEYINFIISLTIVEILNIFYRIKREIPLNDISAKIIIDTFYDDIIYNKISVYSVTDTHI